MKTCPMCVGAVALGLMGGAAAVMPWGSPRAAVAAPAAEDAPFAVDRVHTSVVFRVQRTNGAPYYGRFNDVSGSFLLNHDDPGKSAIDISIDTGSVDTNSEGRNRHLRSADFFAAEEHPKATFKATGFTRVGEMEYDVAGDLTIRGTTRSITARVKQTGLGPARRGVMCGLDVSFTIKRGEFGVSYGPGALSDEVRIMAGIEGNRAQ
ncbi:MAG: YceI family protein [Phycisphaerae bacterium]|nr:YceI family protein [Phycisphaerae bacterium]